MLAERKVKNAGINHVIIAYNLLAYLSFSAQYDSNKGECMVIFICCCHLFFYFKSGSGIMISMAKGFGLAIFVVLIIWGAMLLYNGS